MNKEKNNFQIKFANNMGMLASRFSLNSTVGQLYGLLYMSPEPVSLNEMVKKLAISKGSASTNIRILESWGAVKKVWVDNSRKDYYEADPNTLDIIKQRVIEGLHRRLNETKSSIDMVNNSLEGKNRYSAQREQFYKKRLQKTRKMYEQVNDLLELFSKD
ncbi:MAG: hypothetical protein PF545_07890 [Elusimicrobia bacterium]|jgi:DNA-binding transcriptional regulator GbsR (MarR family)|nr:hypothetical protein [Elusimicrobiota bacterium]